MITSQPSTTSRVPSPRMTLLLTTPLPQPVVKIVDAYLPRYHPTHIPRFWTQPVPAGTDLHRIDTNELCLHFPGTVVTIGRKDDKARHWAVLAEYTPGAQAVEVAGTDPRLHADLPLQPHDDGTARFERNRLPGATSNYRLARDAEVCMPKAIVAARPLPPAEIDTLDPGTKLILSNDDGERICAALVERRGDTLRIKAPLPDLAPKTRLSMFKALLEGKSAPALAKSLQAPHDEDYAGSAPWTEQDLPLESCHVVPHPFYREPPEAA